MTVDQITYEIIGCAFTIHKALGPGLLESAYLHCMNHELPRRGLAVEMEVALPLVYNGVRTKKGYRVDLLVQNCVVVEVKAEKRIPAIEEAQIQTYLKLLNLKIGLILNFNVRWMKDGIKRVINPGFMEPRPPLR
ncbi:MAG: GxxExxY protein [Gemmatimonadota bacterium]